MRKVRTNKERIERFDIIVEKDMISPTSWALLPHDDIQAYLVLNILDQTIAGSREMILMDIGPAMDIISPVVDAHFVERRLSFPLRAEIFDNRMTIISELDVNGFDYSSLIIDSYVRELVGMDPVSTLHFKQSVSSPQRETKNTYSQKRSHPSFKIDPYDELLAKLCGISLDPEPDTDDSIMDIICKTLDIHSSKNTETDPIIFSTNMQTPDWLKGGEDLMKDGEIAMIIGSTISAKDFLTAYQTFSDEEVMEMYGIESKNELKEIVSSLVKRYKLK